MAFIFRFTTVKKGAIVITGNTLGLSKANNTNGPGTQDSIGGFITTSATLPTPAAWAGIVNLANNENITFNWQENSSSAFLNMPPGSTVVYAELIWGGIAVNGNINVSSFINSSIIFTTPAGLNFVSPDPVTSITLPGPGGGDVWYSNSQNVTSLVSTGGVGKYTTGGVPSALNATNNSTNFAGWTLIVVYNNNTLPARNMSVFSGAEIVQQGQTVDTTVSGFITPAAGAITARILSSTGEGDASRTGDYMQFGPTLASLTKLFGPNNPANPPNAVDNFFGSQINIGDPNNVNVGAIDTTGTFGSRNSNPFTATNIIGGRQGWDITNVNGSSALVNNQSSAAIRFATNSDVYMPTSLAIQIDTIFTDISVIKTGTPNPVIAGEVIIYTITISNAGPEDAKNVILTDTVPSQITTPQYSTDGGATWNTWISPYHIGTVPNGNSVDIQIRGTVNPSTTGTIANTSIITTSTPDSDTTNNTSTAVTQVNTSADILVTKTVSPSSASPGQSIIYTINVENNGPSDAQSTILIDTLPNQILNQEFSIDGGSTWNPWVSPYSIGTIPVNGLQVILLRGVISQATTDTITNTAIVSSATSDPNPNNNTSSVDLTISPLAALSVLKQGIPNPVVAGTTITYDMLISNAGPANAQNVVLVDTLPNQVLNPEFSTDGGSTWNTWVSPYNIGIVPANNSTTILIRGIVNSSLTGSLTNTAVVNSSTPDQNLENNFSTATVPITPLADMFVIKQGLPNPVIAGDTLSYALSIGNIGPSDAQNVALIDAIPNQILNPEFSIDGGSTWNLWINPYTIGTLSVGDTQTTFIRGKVNPSTTTTITNTATISSTTTDPNQSDNVSQTNTPVNTSADISVVKLGNLNPVQAGTTLTYTIVITNLGLSDAQNVTLIDTIPNQMLNPEFSIDGGSTWNPWINPYNVGTLPANNSKSVLIRGLINSLATGVLINTAIVDSSTPDPNTQNNTSTLLTGINNSADVSVLKIGTPNPVISGTTLTYTVLVSNAGPDLAQNVALIDTVPNQVLSPQFSTDGGSTWNPWVTPYTLGNLAVNTPQTILISGIVNTLSTGNIINTAIVTSSTPDNDLTNNISQENTAINILSDVSVTKSASPNPVVNGQILTYTIIASNSGPNNATNVILIDTVPSQLLNQEFSTDLGSTWNPWVTPYGMGSLNIGASKTILIRGTVSSFATGNINNTAIVTSNNPDDNVTNNTSETSTQVFNLADVQVIKIADLDKVNPGQILTYTMTITNNGPADSQGVVLNDNVPSQLLNQEFSTDLGITWNPWISPYNIGSLANGNSIAIKIRGIVDTLAVGVIKNTAIVSAITPDSIINNNISTIDTQTADVADIFVIKTESPLSINAGEDILYTIAIVNNGPNDAQNVVLIDTIPSQILNQEFSVDGGSTWNSWNTPYSVGTLPNGNLINILIRGKTNPSTPGTISNTAIVKSTTRDLNPSNNIFTVTTPLNALADIEVLKLSNPETIVAGNILRYNIIVSNAGPSDAQNVTITDTIPSQILNPEISIDNGSTWNPWINPYNIGTLPASSVVPILIRGTVNPSEVGTIVNTAITSSTTLDSNPRNNISTVTTPITTFSDISVKKSPDKNTVVAGENISYTITVLNIGPSVAQSVTLIDTVPACILSPQYSLDGINFVPWSGSIGLGDLAVSSQTTVYINGLVDSGCTGILDNTAIVNSITPGPNTGNNISTSTIPISPLADIRVEKSSNSNPVVAGEQIIYTISISNAGPSVAQSVTLSDIVTPCILSPQYSLDGINFLPWPGSINFGNMSVNATTIVNIKGLVDPGCTGNLPNTASLESVTPDPNPSNSNSTIVIPISPLADISVSKTSDNDFVTTNDQVIYTITVSNSGPSNSVNVTLTDTIPTALKNPEYSTDGINYSPWFGSINLGTITTSMTETIYIRGTVSQGAMGTVTNTAIVSATTPDPNPSNNTSTKNIEVNIVNLRTTKSTNKNYADVGEVIIYTIDITNNGNITANNLVIIDTIPNGTSLVSGSINSNVPFIGDNPQNGITISNGIAPNQTVILTFKAVVNQIPVPNPIPNNAVINYIYNPCKVLRGLGFNIRQVSCPSISGSTISNTVTTTINNGVITQNNAIKSSNKNSTTLGDTITYTISLKNTGNVPVNNVVIKDIIPIGTSFVTGSVIVGGIPKPSENPNIGINVGTIPSNTTIITTFKVTVLQGAPAILTNQADVYYSYNVDPINPPIQKEVQTNTVNIGVLKPSISLVKSSNRTGAVVGDTIRYSITALNNGQIDLINVIVTDTLAKELSYNDNLTINSIPDSQSIITGVNIGALIIGQTTTIAFDAKVITIPSNGFVENESIVNYNYIVAGSNFKGNGISNIFDVRIYNPNINVTKTANEDYVKTGDIFEYTILVKNTGDIEVNNAIVKDVLTSEFNLLDITVDGNHVSGDISTGINIGTILVNQTRTIVLTVQVIGYSPLMFENVAVVNATATIDNNFPVVSVKATGTNDININIYVAILKLTKSADKKYATVGDNVTYTIVAENKGSVTLGNAGLNPVVIFDPLKPSLSFISGSVKVDGVPQPQANISGGINIGQLIEDQIKTITFNAKVLSDSISPITNIATGIYGYQLPGFVPQIGTTISNPVSIIPESVNIDVVKIANKDFVSLGEIITYTVTLANTGTVDAINVVFKDSLPKGTELIEGSFSVNGVVINNVNLSFGVNIGSIPKNTMTTVQYDVRVVLSNCCLKLINSAILDYYYILPDGTAGNASTKASSTSTSTVNINVSNFKQFNVEKYLEISSQKPPIEEINEVIGVVKITKTSIVKTDENTSLEGQHLGQYKLVVNGVLTEIIEYTTCNDKYSVYSASYNIPFSTFIVLPSNYVKGAKLDIKGTVEKIYYKFIDCKTFFTDAQLLINVKVLCC